MGVGIWNLVVGCVIAAAGLSQQYTVPFTNSWEALAGIGVAIAILGVYQIVQSKRGR